MQGALFISHASADETTVNEIVAYLEAHSVPCWLASRDIPPRSLYAEAIARGIEQSSACAVVVSAAANSSDAVKRELELASHYRKPFVPIRIDTSEVGPSFNYYLRNTQWIDYHVHGPDALQRIVNDFQGVGRAAMPASATGEDTSAPAQREMPGANPKRAATLWRRRVPGLPGYALPLLIAVTGISLLVLLWNMNSTPRQVGYPPQYETNFMGACQNQGSTPQRCACIWDRIEANIDPNSFAALEQLAGPEREAHPLMQQIQQYSHECPSVPAGSAEPPPAP